VDVADGPFGFTDAAKLRALLRATELITSELSIERVLQHIVEAACSLADARYAALGVIGHDGSLEEFVYAGMDDRTARRIGRFPQGKGLLGALIHDPRPIRLPDLGADERSTGFPPNHPPMTSFLGVPIRVRGEVFGNLYITESAHGEFSAEDEQLVVSLAIAAGSAIANARTYHESRLQQRWLAASVGIAAELLGSRDEDPLQTIARCAKDIADADLVSVGVIMPGGEKLSVHVAIGVNADDIRGREFELAGSLAGRAAAERAPLLIRAPGDIGDAQAVMASALDAGPVMVIPLIGAGQVLGVLNIVRRRGAVAFRRSDLDMAAGFASQASLALVLADARSDQQRIALLEERDRIARDLHDHVIQQLFAVGLSLQGLAAQAAQTAEGAEIADALQARVDDIDGTIRQIRTSIFQLRGPLVGGGSGLRASVLQVVGELTPVLGFSPSVTFAGPLDAMSDDELTHDVKACVREALTNVAKYASAGRVSVDLSLEDGRMRVRVADDGVGIGRPAAYSGLQNLRRRAERRGGTFDIRSPAEGGTELVWEGRTA
jgi:signal transduction histidine kinase